jgi:hypothetical protein
MTGLQLEGHARTIDMPFQPCHALFVLIVLLKDALKLIGRQPLRQHENRASMS